MAGYSGHHSGARRTSRSCVPSDRRNGLNAALTWYQSSALASAVGDSPTITAVLSAFHALGFTFIMGGALFANLGKLGVLFPSRRSEEVAVPGSRLIAL